MPKYAGPEHTTEIFLSERPVRRGEDGLFDVPDDLSSADAARLCGAGFAPVPTGESPVAEPASAPAPEPASAPEHSDED